MAIINAIYPKIIEAKKSLNKKWRRFRRIQWKLEKREFKQFRMSTEFTKWAV